MKESRAAKKPTASAKKKAEPTDTQNSETDLPVDGGVRLALPGFEGPLDLLLHLIQEHELDILNIPIAFVTKKYLEYMNLMTAMNIDIASEYLVMAATLAHIKSRMLLPIPPPEVEEGDEEERDPRAELIKRLLEYQKYKKASEELASRSVLGRDIFVRGPQPALDSSTAPLAPVASFKLLEAFQRILSRNKMVIDHQVEFERFSISDRINQLVDMLKGKGRILFEDLFEGDKTRPDLIVTFLALLELTRLRVILLFQEGSLEPISVEFVEEGLDGADTSELDRPSEEVRPKKAPEPEPPRGVHFDEPEPEPEEDENGDFDVAALLAEVAAEQAEEKRLKLAAEAAAAGLLAGEAVTPSEEAVAEEAQADEPAEPQGDEAQAEEVVAEEAELASVVDEVTTQADEPAEPVAAEPQGDEAQAEEVVAEEAQTDAPEADEPAEPQGDEAQAEEVVAEEAQVSPVAAEPQADEAKSDEAAEPAAARPSAEEAPVPEEDQAIRDISSDLTVESSVEEASENGSDSSEPRLV